MNTKPDRALLNELYQPSTKAFVFVDVPEMPFATLRGEGSPDSEDYARSVKWLFTAISPIRQTARKRMGKDFIEPPLETLYWTGNTNDKSLWRWKLMIVLPEWVDDETFSRAVVQAQNKLGDAVGEITLERIKEGRCVQIIHVGSYEHQAETLNRMHREFLPGNNLAAAGPHHEIYLNDPNRVRPEKQKTVLRQPVCKLD